MPKTTAKPSPDIMLRVKVARYIEQTSDQLADLLDEFRDSLEHKGAGPRREVETVLREIEAVADGLSDAAGDLENQDEDLW